MGAVRHGKNQARDPNPGAGAVSGRPLPAGARCQLHFVILTRPACVSIRYIHDRMPVIFPPALHDPWLHGSTPVRLLEYAETEVEEAVV